MLDLRRKWDGTVLYTVSEKKRKKFENWLRFDKVRESLKVGTFFETQCIVILGVN